MFFVPPSKLPARALAGMALASFAAVGVAQIPLGACVEIELIAEVQD